MTKLFLDTANWCQMENAAKNPLIEGFTTNPTLMRAAGVDDYAAYGRRMLTVLRRYSVSLEVFADEPAEMLRQARLIASWGPNAVVKIPITNTAGESMLSRVVTPLLDEHIAVNVTAVMTMDQIRAAALREPTYISVFAGRIADTGCNPVPIINRAVELTRHLTHTEIIWASPREVYNVWQADECGCDIITIPPEMLPKLALRDKPLNEFSLDTVKMFHEDARKAGYVL